VFFRAFFVPYPASTGLGGSWQAGLTEASMRGLVFGRDIIFTYGPLGYLGVGIGTEASYPRIWVFAFVLALVLAVLVAYCAGEKGALPQGVAFVLVILICLVDILPIDIVSIALIVAFTLPQFRAEKAAPLSALILGLACGLALLMKFNMGVAACASGIGLLGWRASRGLHKQPQGDLKALFVFCVGATAAASAFFAHLDYGYAAAAVLASGALLSAVVCSNPNVRNSLLWASIAAAGLCTFILACSPTFRAFVGTSMQIAMGYSAAMSLHGADWEIGFALGVFALVGLVLFANLRELSAPVVAALLISLFFGYKEGFVRQDLHVLYAFWTALLICGTVLRLAAGRRLLAINGVVTLIAIFALSVVGRADGAPESPLNALSPAWFARDLVRFMGSWRSGQQVAAIDSDGLRPDRLAPSVVKAIGKSSVDVEPWETSIVFANGLTWNPDPVLQAYSAYTPALDQVDAQHVRMSGAARMLYLWDAIDGRHPLWDQPGATREILCNYAIDPAIPRIVVTEENQDVLVVKRVPNRCGPATPLSSHLYSWNEPIPIVSSDDLVFMSLDVRYSLLGQVLKLLFRAPAVRLRVVSPQGEFSDYRIVAENGRDGILIAPLPQSLDQLQRFLQRNVVRRPSSVELVTNAPYFFQSRIECSFSIVRYR
jgi:hypothetical protein